MKVDELTFLYYNIWYKGLQDPCNHLLHFTLGGCKGFDGVLKPRSSQANGHESLKLDR